VQPELGQRPEWKRTGNTYFPSAALVDGQWWVLRLNSFPDHPLWTLFVNGQCRFDLDDAPPGWGRPADDTLPRLSEHDTATALGPVEQLVAYGSESGDPCDNPFCCG
jgi:hypothetical protein